MLEPVHEMEKDRSTGQAKLVRINPTRTFGRGSASGVSWFTWQSGRWYDLAGHVLEEKDIPEDVRAELNAHPVVVDTGGPEVTKVCQWCNEAMNSSQLEDHLNEHVRNAMQGAGAAVKAAPVPGLDK